MLVSYHRRLVTLTDAVVDARSDEATVLALRQLMQFCLAQLPRPMSRQGERDPDEMAAIFACLSNPNYEYWRANPDCLMNAIAPVAVLNELFHEYKIFNRDVFNYPEWHLFSHRYLPLILN